MKLAYLIAEFPKPSETFVSREVITLQRLGLPVEVFALKAPNARELTKLDPKTRHLASKVHYLSYREAGAGLPHAWRKIIPTEKENTRLQHACTLKTNRYSRLLRALALARRCQEQKITHLHAHWPCATQIAYLVHQLIGLPFSVSIHAHEVEHDFGHFPAVFGALSFATFCNHAAMERLLGRLGSEARAKSHLVYHGVDLSGFGALPFPNSPGPLRVISAGRLTRTKGFDRLVRACARYKQLGGAVELTLLGEGTLSESLRQLSRELDFEQDLHLPGWLPHDQVARHMADSHLFALMADTNFHDGLPNVLLEAMACARPAIISPLPASGEAITNGVEGYVLRSADDESGMVEALRLCASQRATLGRMGEAARARVTQAFDQDLHGKSLLALFQEIPRRMLAAI
jgi:colanic acid/amylovoran biosynthesis glycosyltransferase